ncbi:MAG TPA: hypothetical protein VK918_00650 [Pyrinomonadaceae bacterium]|nr:hypothetical protein [Pyrinomonadaceae bacterium]
MKRCPECGRDYNDDSMSFCLDDGSELLFGPALMDEPATAILPAPSAAGGLTHPTDESELKTAMLRPSATGGGSDSARGFDKRLLGFPILFAIIVLGGFLGYRYFSTPSTKQIDSIAVMPFVNESGNADVEYLSDGMTETLINSLSKIPNLSVKARSTVFSYKGQISDPADIGRRLAVQAVLNGRVVQRGDDITLYLSLVDARTGDQIWGDSYERKLADLALLQKEVTRDVSRNLREHLSGADVSRLTKNYTDDAEAYQFYARGRHHLLKATHPDILASIRNFQQAIELDPGYALAYVGLADAFRAPVAETDPAEALARSKAAAQKAIELDDTLADAHAVMGWIAFWYEWDWEASERNLRRAIELDGNNAEAHLFYSHLLSNTGRHAEALLEARRARELDPLNIRINALEGQYLIHAGQVDEGLARLQATKELDPNSWMAHLFSTSGYIEKSMFAEAIAEGHKTVELSPHSRSFSFLAVALAKAGRQAEARKELQTILNMSRERWISPYSVALVYNALGDREQTLSWLERALTERDPRMVFLKVEPKWNNLRSDPQFQNLLKRLNFPA